MNEEEKKQIDKIMEPILERQRKEAVEYFIKRWKEEESQREEPQDEAAA